MSKNKYNVGDIVLIRNDLQLWERYGVESIVPPMLDLCGKYARITGNDDEDFYQIEGSDYHWSKEMFARKAYKSEFATDEIVQNKGENKMINYIIERPIDEKLKKQVEEIFGKGMQSYILSEPFLSLDSYKIVMPEIVNYTYNPETGETYIKWFDKSETTVVAENPETADQYVGFVTAYAKKAAGNTSHITGLFEKWAIKKPAKELKKQILNNNKLLEEKRIAEKRKAKKEQWLILKEARKLKREYEAKKLANEKYGVPMDEDK